MSYKLDVMTMNCPNCSSSDIQPTLDHEQARCMNCGLTGPQILIQDRKADFNIKVVKSFEKWNFLADSIYNLIADKSEEQRQHRQTKAEVEKLEKDLRAYNNLKIDFKELQQSLTRTENDLKTVNQSAADSYLLAEKMQKRYFDWMCVAIVLMVVATALSLIIIN